MVHGRGWERKSLLEGGKLSVYDIPRGEGLTFALVAQLERYLGR